MKIDVVERAKKIILTPKEEWDVIDEEQHTVQGLYTGYVMILAAIPAVANFIGFSIIGLGGVLSTFRMSIPFGLANMLLTYALGLGLVYVLALFVDWLAPSFGGEKNFIQSLKLVTFASTPWWVAGVFSFLPALWILKLLGLYSFYVLYVGLPILKNVTDEKAIPYMAVVVIGTIVLGVVIGALIALTIPGTMRGF